MAIALELASMSTEGTKGIVVAGLPSDGYAPEEDTNENIDELVTRYCSMDSKLKGVYTLADLISKYAARSRKIAYSTSQKCSDPLFDQAEIECRLTIEIWLAVTSFDPERGTAISSWIFGRMQQCCGLIVEGQYNKRKGVSVLDIQSSLEDDPNGEDSVSGMQIQKRNDVPPDVIESLEHVEMISSRIQSIMKEEKDNPLSERNIFDLFMSDELLSDSDIAKLLDCDWAKVGDVRLKAKVAIAILCGIDFCTFTKSKQLEPLARRVAKALGVTNFDVNVRPLLDAETPFDTSIWDSYSKDEFAVVLADA